MTWVNHDPKRFIPDPNGDVQKAKLYIKNSYKKITQALLAIDFTNGIGDYKRTLPDGGHVHVQIRMDTLPKIYIYFPPAEAEKEEATVFQCDLYEDHPTTPEDLTTQTKRAIKFNVINGTWADISERQGNIEWFGKNNDVISWEGTQCWSRGITDKVAWNDSIPGPWGEGTGWPYDPRPTHATRRGEITIKAFNYPDTNSGLVDWGLLNLNYLAQYVNSPSNTHLFTQYVWINNVKYIIDFQYVNTYIMGACIGESPNGDKWVILVAQNLRETASEEGIDFGYEELYYFKLDPTNTNPTPIFLLKLDYVNGSTDIYTTSKSHLTPWAFNQNGTKGSAWRTCQYFISSPPQEWGPYNDPMVVFADITYNNDGPSATYSYNVGAISAAYTPVPGGATLTSQEVSDNIDAYHAFWAWLAEECDFGYFNKYENATVQSAIETVDGLRLTPWIVEWDNGKFSGYTTHTKLELTNWINNDNYSGVWTTTIYYGRAKVYSYSYTGTTTRNEVGLNTLQDDCNDYRAVFVCGASPRNKILFFIEVSLGSSTFRTNQTYNTTTQDATCYDTPYTVTVSLKCAAENSIVTIGSPVVYSAPSRFDIEDYNAASAPVLFTKGDAYQKEVSINASDSPFRFQALSVGPQYFDWTSFKTGANSPSVADFGGSIRYSKDGSHAVLSCSYMQIAKYIWPLHRHIRDANYNTSTLNRKETMTKLGVSSELQTAWNKYMINYAIIITKSGEIEVKQLSNLLFGKVVKDPDKLYGIEEKDTNAYLPIGIYGGT